MEPKKKELYDRQVSMLKLFLSKGAITQAQFEKSYGDLTAKMWPEGVEEKPDRSDSIK